MDFFSDKQDVVWLECVAASWIGTPFVHRAAVKGAGVDCVQLVGAMMVECGVIESYDFGSDYWLQPDARRSLVMEWLAGCDAVRLATGEPVRAGDVLCFTVGKVVHHCGVALGGTRFIHAMAKRVVQHGDLRDTTYAKRLTAVYRPIKK